MEKKLSKGMLMAVLICGSIVPVLMGASSVYAAEAEDDALSSFTLDPMVITATRTEKRDVDVPAATEILSNEQIVRAGATNAMEALRQVNGIEMNQTFAGGSPMTVMYSEINVRGYNGGTLVMLNGNPVNMNNVYNIDSIPADQIEKIEIVKGGGSVLYGSEAMGGVVNIITKKKASNSISMGMGNFGRKKLDVSAGNDKFHVNYNLNRWGTINHLSDYYYNREQTDPKDYAYTQNKNLKENIGVGFNITDKLSIEYNRMRSDVDYHRNKIHGGAFDQWRDTSTTDNMAQLNYIDDSFKGHIWYHKKKVEYFGGTKPGISVDSTNTRRDTNAFGVDLQKDIQINKKSLLTVGTNYKYEQLYQVRDKGNTKPEDQVRVRNTYALFAQLDHKFTDKDNFIVGGRGTWTKGSWRGQNHHNFSAEGEYMHKFDENQGMYVKVAQSFIMPTFSEMKPTGILPSDPNPDLRPQKGLNYELGYKALAGNHTWKAALFHMKVKDHISAKVYNTPERHYRYENEDYKNTGFEAGLNVDLNKKLAYNIGFTIQDPKYGDSDGRWERRYGKYQVKGGISYNLNKFNAALSGSYIWDRYVNPSSQDAYKGKPYFLTNLTASYAPDKNSEFSLMIDNLLDRNDNLSSNAINGGGYYATPINFIVSYTYKF